MRSDGVPSSASMALSRLLRIVIMSVWYSLQAAGALMVGLVSYSTLAIVAHAG